MTIMRSSTIVGAALCCTLAGAIAFAQDTKSSKPATQSTAPTASAPAAANQGGLPEGFELPPGMTEEEFAQCMSTCQPAEMHEWLSADAGSWTGKCTTWMSPDAKPEQTECTLTVTPTMGGRFFQSQINAIWPGMGPYEGFCITGYDNVSGQFQSTWCDSCGTGMAIGTGELSSDKTTLTLNYTFNCPMKKGPVNMREVFTRTGPNTTTMELWFPAQDTGKEFKMMEVAYTRCVPTTTTQANAR